MDPQKQKRVDELNAVLRDSVTGKKPLHAPERNALRNELAQIFADDAAAAARPLDPAKQARLDEINARLRDAKANLYAPERAALAGEAFDILNSPAAPADGTGEKR